MYKSCHSPKFTSVQVTMFYLAVLSFIVAIASVQAAYDPNTQVYFCLFTQANPTNYFNVTLATKTNLLSSNFNATLPTRIIIHGWKHNITNPMIQQGKTAYLEKGPYNVFGVDWSAGGGNPDYGTARNTVAATGLVVGQFIEYLESIGVDIKTVNVVGWSLGAHVSGCAGKRLNGRLPFVVGTDPAGPFFSPGGVDTLASTDANYVEVIHTNYGNLGMYYQLGHADFYVNGGVNQYYQCIGQQEPLCSHQLSCFYFVESIRSGGFTARKCNTGTLTGSSCQYNGTISTQMGGEPLVKGEPGVYFLNTNTASPYSKG